MPADKRESAKRLPHPPGEVCFNQVLALYMSFIHEDFLLSTKTARRLYHQFAEDEPILDYHCHLPPKDVAENRRFQNLFEIWLEGDHYKWRAMRANGVAGEPLHRRRRRRTRNSWPGRAPCRPRCAIRCITGRTWN